MNKIKFNRINVFVVSVSVFLLALLAIMIYLLVYIFKEPVTSSPTSNGNNLDKPFLIEDFGR